MADGPTITVKLSEPFDFGERRVEVLTFRKGRLGDMHGIEVGGANGIAMEKIMLVASRLSGESLEVIKRLEEGDAGRVVKIALGFIERCLRTGGEP